MTDRKAELARLCRLEIRKTSALSKSRMSEYGYHLVEAVVDAEVEVMMERLTDKSVQSDDVPILRELVIADLWPRLKAAHRERRDVAFRKLIADFPDIVVHYGDFAFDGGWIPLVRDACERMRTYPKAWKIRLDGGKEKFGCCDLHVSCVVAERGAMSEVMRMREEIRLRSLSTCEICGGSGRLRLGGYAMTVCDKHAAIFEEFREDDGRWADPWRWHEEERSPEDHIDDVVALGRAVMTAAADEIADVKAGLDELDRGERVDIDDVIAKAHAIVDERNLDEMDESNDPMRLTALGRRIDDDIQAAVGRERELLTEYGYYIDTAVRAARSVVDEQRAEWISSDIARWDELSAAPMSEADRKWLLDYVVKLVAERDLSG